MVYVSGYHSKRIVFFRNWLNSNITYFNCSSTTIKRRDFLPYWIRVAKFSSLICICCSVRNLITSCKNSSLTLFASVLKLIWMPNLMWRSENSVLVSWHGKAQTIWCHIEFECSGNRTGLVTYTGDKVQVWVAEIRTRRHCLCCWSTHPLGHSNNAVRYRHENSRKETMCYVSWSVFPLGSVQRVSNAIEMAHTCFELWRAHLLCSCPGRHTKSSTACIVPKPSSIKPSSTVDTKYVCHSLDIGITEVVGTFLDLRELKNQGCVPHILGYLRFVIR